MEGNVWVSVDVFEGSDDAWGRLKVGDVLRVEAEEDDYKQKGKSGLAPCKWKATEAILISKAKTDTAKMKKEAMKEAEVSILAIYIFNISNFLWYMIHIIIIVMEQAMVMTDAENKVGEVLSLNLHGKG